MGADGWHWLKISLHLLLLSIELMYQMNQNNLRAEYFFTSTNEQNPKSANIFQALDNSKLLFSYFQAGI